MRRLVAVVVIALFVSLGTAAFGPAESAAVREEAAVVFAVTEDGPLRLDAFVPAAQGPHPAVVLVHGGGWRSGSRGGWRNTGRALAEQGFAAFSIDYRLSGVATFPAAPDDVRTAIAWVRANAARFDVDPTRLALVGGSAGANLALVAGTGGTGPLQGGERVAAIVAWSPPVDLTAPPTALLAELATEYLGCRPRRCRDAATAASAHTHLDPTDPPVLVVNSRDELVPLREATSLESALRAAQVDHRLVVLDGSAHASEYRDAVWSDTLAFLRRTLARPG